MTPRTDPAAAPPRLPVAHLEWPFFDERHRELGAWLADDAAARFAPTRGSLDHDDVDAACRQLVRQLGDAGWLRHAVAGAAYGGASEVIDTAVQLWGGAGVARGNVVEQLYREIRALRIYEGATEVQQLIIARELLKRGTAA